MSNVIDLRKYQHRQALGQKSDDTTIDETMADVIARNKETKEREAKDRQKSNSSVFRAFRIKGK